MDLYWYLRTLEEVVIWVGNHKLAALGIRVAHWIRVALNVTTDLTPFKWIIPCGIRDRQVGYEEYEGFAERSS